MVRRGHGERADSGAYAAKEGGECGEAGADEGADYLGVDPVGAVDVGPCGGLDVGEIDVWVGQWGFTSKVVDVDGAEV